MFFVGIGLLISVRRYRKLACTWVFDVGFSYLAFAIA